MNWTDGEFEIDFGASSDRTTTTRSTTGLLMEAMRLMDEASSDSVEKLIAAMRVAVVTVSDSAARGDAAGRLGTGASRALPRTGLAGRLLRSSLRRSRCAREAPRRAGRCPDSADLMLTTGGTGIGPRDTTPEATAAVCQKTRAGLGELMREKGQPEESARRAFARGGRRACKNALIVNLPGSPRGAVESLDAVAELLPHAVEVLRGASHG